MGTLWMRCLASPNSFLLRYGATPSGYPATPQPLNQ
jgi:hypothetical protein